LPADGGAAAAALGITVYVIANRFRFLRDLRYADPTTPRSTT
jgi:hypothetical protein